MRTKIIFLALLLLPLLFFINCKKQSPKKGAIYQGHKPSMTVGEQFNFVGFSRLEIPDSLKTIACSGCQISRSKVKSMLETVNLSRETLAFTSKTDSIKKIIVKLKKLLQKQRVDSDKELLFTVYGILGSEYLRLYSVSGKNNTHYLKQAMKYTKSAISIFENSPKYKADLTASYSILTGILFLKNNYDKAISLIKYLIENYQEVGLGPYENWYASQKVKSLKNLLQSGKLKPQKTQKTTNYFKTISAKYHNEVGITAQVALQQHYLKLGNQDKVEGLAVSIKNRLDSLNNVAFKRDVREMQKLRLIRVKNMQANQQSERDTVYYEIERKKIKTATISKLRNHNRYFINIQLKKQDQSEFAQLTAANIGNTLAIIYKDNVVSSPTIQSIISSGNFSIGPFEKQKKAKTIKQQLLRKQE